MSAPPGPSDAELVAGVLQADRDAFAQVYDRYGPRLYDFSYSMLRHREDAADAVADAFVTFAEKLPQLREPDRLRPWLYAIVRSECLRRLKARKRVSYGDDETLLAMPDDSITPEQAAEQAALQKIVWDAAAGLADRDRALLDLHLRQGLDGADLGEAMGVSAANAYVMLNRLRAQVDRSLGALLIARLGREDCSELDDLLRDWDGTFSPLIRKRVARHVESCGICGERRKKILSPWMLLAGVPLFVAPLTLRERVLNDTQLVAYSSPATASSGWSTSTKSAAAAGLIAAATVTAVLLWPDSQSTPTVALSPSEASQTTGPPEPTPVEPTPAPSAAATSGPATATTTPTPSEPAPAPAPGALSVSATSIDLGRDQSRSTLRIRNTGDLALDFTVSQNTPWLRVSPPSGALAGGKSLELTVLADRSALPEGPASSTFRIATKNRTVTVRVSLETERGPVVDSLITPTGTATPACQVPVSVDVTDESGVASVQLSWSGPVNGRTAMTMARGLWRGSVDGITTGGNYTLTVLATDSRGNTTTRTTTLQIDPCPQ